MTAPRGPFDWVETERTSRAFGRKKPSGPMTYTVESGANVFGLPWCGRSTALIIAALLGALVLLLVIG